MPKPGWLKVFSFNLSGVETSFTPASIVYFKGISVTSVLAALKFRKITFFV